MYLPRRHNPKVVDFEPHQKEWLPQCQYWKRHIVCFLAVLASGFLEDRAHNKIRNVP